MNWLILQGVASVVYFLMVTTVVCLSGHMRKRDKVIVIGWMTCIALLMFSFGAAAGKHYVLNKLSPATVQK